MGVALGAKGVRPSLPLWVLIFASQLPDWADATVCIAGMRSSTPGIYSHSFPALSVLVAIAAGVYLATTRDVIGSAFVAALVISHALADYITGLKPTWIGGPMIGLRLYHHPAWDFAVETVVILIGWLVYRASLSRERRSSQDVWSLLAVLIALQAVADIVFYLSAGFRKC